MFEGSLVSPTMFVRSHSSLRKRDSHCFGLTCVPYTKSACGEVLTASSSLCGCIRLWASKEVTKVECTTWYMDSNPMSWCPYDRRLGHTRETPGICLQRKSRVKTQ
jgi:hypothetical protein